jgi:hypothetical protein
MLPCPAAAWVGVPMPLNDVQGMVQWPASTHRLGGDDEGVLRHHAGAVDLPRMVDLLHHLHLARCCAKAANLTTDTAMFGHALAVLLYVWHPGWRSSMLDDKQQLQGSRVGSAQPTSLLSSS